MRKKKKGGGEKWKLEDKIFMKSRRNWRGDDDIPPTAANRCWPPRLVVSWWHVFCDGQTRAGGVPVERQRREGKRGREQGRYWAAALDYCELRCRWWSVLNTSTNYGCTLRSTHFRYLSIYLSHYLSTYLPIHLSIHLSTYSFIHLSIHPPIHHLPIYPCIHPYTHPSFIYSFIHPTNSTNFIYLSNKSTK